MCICIHANIQTITHVHIYAKRFSRSFSMCMYVHTYIHSRMYVYTHTHTHIFQSTLTLCETFPKICIHTCMRTYTSHICSSQAKSVPCAAPIPLHLAKPGMLSCIYMIVYVHAYVPRLHLTTPRMSVSFVCLRLCPWLCTRLKYAVGLCVYTRAFVHVLHLNSARSGMYVYYRRVYQHTPTFTHTCTVCVYIPYGMAVNACVNMCM